MKEILFRAKDMETGKWLYGWIFGGRAKSIIEINRPYPNEYIIKTYCTSIIKKLTIEQYTGLDDKNDTKIFKKDVVSFEGIKWDSPDGSRAPYIRVVNYSEIHTSFNFEIPNGLLAMPFEASDIEVIGNIHDNPELMEERA